MPPCRCTTVRHGSEERSDNSLPRLHQDNQADAGVDPSEVELYDIVVQIHPMTVDDAVGTLKLAAQLPAFQTTPEVKKTLEELAAQAEADAKA